MKIDPITGLPEDLANIADLSKESKQITVKLGTGRYGKVVTIMEGFSPTDMDMKSLLKFFKNKLACGGSIKKNSIVIQGGHKTKVTVNLVVLTYK